MVDLSDMRTPSEAARELGCSAEWVRRLTKCGRLPCVPTPLGRLIPRAAVEALRRERAARQAEPEPAA